jgi:hypothetical protein
MKCKDIDGQFASLQDPIQFEKASPRRVYLDLDGPEVELMGSVQLLLLSLG